MTWQLDTSHSQLDFSVKHMMISTVRGTFAAFESQLDIDLHDLTSSRIEGRIDVGSIETGDENRDNHLRSGDFFDVEQFPYMTFVGRRIEKVGGDRFKVHGDLTIRDVTKPLVFDVVYEGSAQDPWGGRRIGFSASTSLSRKEFGLEWNVALETGGWLVGDQIKIAAEIQLIEQQEVVAELA